MPAGTKTKKRNNAEQERFYAFQHRKTRKHHGVVRFWRHLYKGHAHTHTHTKKKIYQLERTTIASNRCFQDHTQPHAKPFPRTSGTCFAHFFFSPTGPPRDRGELRNDRPPPNARGLAVSSARSWRRGDPGDPPLYVQPLPPIARWLGHRQGVFVAESVGRQVNPSSATGERCCCLLSWH